MSAQRFVERRRVARDRTELKRVAREIRAELADPVDRLFMPTPFRRILEDRLGRVEADLATLDEAQRTVASGIRRMCRALALASGGAGDRPTPDHAGGPDGPGGSGGL